MKPLSVYEADEARQRANGDPDCMQCRGLGYVGYDVAFGHPKFGQLDTCDCFKARRAARAQAQYFATSNLAGQQDKTFATFTASLPGVGTALETARVFAAAPARWLLLTGAYGCGKTHLALAIANQVISQGVQVLYQTAPDFLRSLRATFDRENPAKFDQVFGFAQNVELLVLDDLGAERMTDWAAEQFFGLLDHRYLRDLPTVVVSNLSLAQIGELSARLGSRLADTSKVLHVAMKGAGDYRQMTAQQRQGRAA